MPRPWNKGLRTLFSERLWAKVEVGEPDECWSFVGGWRSRFGYGRIRDSRGRGVQAHKAVYELLVGPVPAGMWLLHSCDNPLCCNPRHQRPGTPLENRLDQFEHGAFARKAA